MFDTEVKHLYEELQRKLKTNSETSLTNVSQEIESTRNTIISRINDMINSHGIQIDSNLIESIVDETLMEDLKTSSRDVLSQSYRTLSQFNDSIQAVVVDQAKKQITKEAKQEQVKVVMDKFDYTMQVYKDNKINMLEQYNHLFQTILRKAPLYTAPELVDDIKNFLTREKDAMERYIQTQRNNIITSNLNSLVESNTYLTEQTDFISTAITQTTEEIETQVRVAEEKVEEEIKQSYEQAQKVEEEIRKETQIQQEQVVQPQPIQQEQVKVDTQQPVQQSQQPTFQEKLDEYKTLYAPSFTSSEQELVSEQPQQVQNQQSQSQNYRILDDGTIEWLTPRNIAPLSEEEQQILASMDQAPSKVDQEVMLVNIVKENINQNLWNDIGIIASNTDNTINVVSGQLSNEVQAILQRNGINGNGVITQNIVAQLDAELKEINNNLSENMIKSFTKINNDTMNAIQQTFGRPDEIKNQDVEQSLEVYRQSTSLASFSLTCEKQFEQCMSKICYQYNIPTNSNAYNELKRSLENKRMQMESQFYNMYMTFSHSNSMFIDKAIGSTMLSQDMMREMQQDLTPQQIQTLIGYNYGEYEKNYFDMKAQQDIEQVSGMRR